MDSTYLKTQHGKYYRTKDFVYLEESIPQPFRIGQILSFKSGPNSTVFVKCRYYDRQRDVESHWARKLSAVSEKSMYTGNFEKKNFAPNTSLEEKAILVHQFKLRELICNKNLMTESDEGYVHASLIRGKCNIYRFIDTESISDYVPKDDTFFYLACLEDQPKHLTIEGEVSVTRSERLARCAKVEDFVAPSADEAADYAKHEVDTLIWDGPSCSLNLDDINMYLAMVRSIGLYGRALDQTRRVNDSSIQSNLAYAFRDSTKYLAYHLLHNSKYNWRDAVVNLFVEKSPVVCTDQLELWTEEDILYFYDEIKKVKRFSDICRKNGTWKSVKEMIEFYYMNKVTESYLATKKERLSKKLAGITQIFIPHSDLPFNGSYSVTKLPVDCSGCEGCKTKESTHWYPWNCKRNYLCLKCWVHWKKYGGLTYSHAADGIKIFDNGYTCSVCCISFTNKRRFNRHSSTHFTHSCDHEGCNQKFSSADQISLHKKYIHESFRKIPQSPNMSSRIFLFVASKEWKKLRKQFCNYSVYTRALCRKKCYSFDRNMLNYENRVPVSIPTKTGVRLGDFSQKMRKRTSSKSSVSNLPNGEPPSKIVPVN